jgi:hypothetical protein
VRQGGVHGIHSDLPQPRRMYAHTLRDWTMLGRSVAEVETRLTCPVTPLADENDLSLDLGEAQVAEPDVEGPVAMDLNESDAPLRKKPKIEPSSDPFSQAGYHPPAASASLPPSLSPTAPSAAAKRRHAERAQPILSESTLARFPVHAHSQRFSLPPRK